MDSAQVAYCIRFKVHRTFLDLPVHACFSLPDFDGLLLRELIAQSMPWSGPSVGHGFDKMCHEVFPSYVAHGKAAEASAGHVRVSWGDVEPIAPLLGLNGKVETVVADQAEVVGQHMPVKSLAKLST